MWKVGSISVVLILLFGSGNFFQIERGFQTEGVNATEWCSMPKSCDVHGFTHWYRVGKHCVKYFQNRLNFAQAELHCRHTAPGAHLVSVHNLKHNNELLCIVKKFHRGNMRIWLGGFEFFKSGHFFWTDGSYWNYNRWVPGEPNHMHTNIEECVEMNWKKTGKWNDDTCSVRKSFICAFEHKFKDLRPE